MDYVVVGGIIIAICLILTLLFYKKFAECNALNSYGLIVIAFTIATLCLAAILAQDEEPLDQYVRLGNCAMLFGVGLLCGLVVAFLRYFHAVKGSGAAAESEGA